MQQSSRILLDFYPSDILQIIVSIAGVNNLTQVLSCPSFLESNNNLKASIDCAISKTSYAFNNHAAKPDILVEWDDDIVEREASDFASQKVFQVFDNYCTENRIDTECSISYIIHDVYDLIELKELCLTLKSSNSAMLSLYLDLWMCRLRLLDLTQLLKVLTGIGNRIIGFSLRNEFDVEIKGVLNLDFFKNFQKLDICGLSFNGSFFKCPNLVKLAYKSPRKKCLLDIADIPPSLKSLSCDLESLTNSTFTAGEFPLLENISFCRCECVPTIIKDILWNMTCPKTSSIRFDGLCGRSVNEFVPLLSKVTSEVGLMLESLSLDGSLAIPLSVYPLTSLELKMQGGNDLSSLQNLPSTLKQLTLSGRGYFKCGDIFSKSPIGLNYLHLSNCDAMKYADTDFSKFKNLKSLKLSDCGIDNSIVNTIQFPDSLEKLNLSDNTIESIDKVKFPQGLVSLCLCCNRLNHIDGHKFPQTLKKLDVSGNKIKSARLLRNESDEELKIESLFLASDSHGLSCCELPTRVQTLLLDQFKPFNGQRIGDNLVSLSIMDCDNFHCINFGTQPKLRYLSMHNCDLEGFNISSLSRLEEIELSFISKVPQGLGHLKKLRYFMLTKSPIEHAVINFYSNSLEVLDLSSNRIGKVQLTFPDGNTNLKRLDLGGNCLKEISLEDIGHTSKSKHSDLCELGLYDNRELSNDLITVLVQQLIIMTKCLWTNETVKIFYNRYENNHLIRNTIEEDNSRGVEAALT